MIVYPVFLHGLNSERFYFWDWTLFVASETITLLDVLVPAGVTQVGADSIVADRIEVLLKIDAGAKEGDEFLVTSHIELNNGVIEEQTYKLIAVRQ